MYQGTGVMMMRQAALDKEPMKVATLTGTSRLTSGGLPGCSKRQSGWGVEKVRKLDMIVAQMITLKFNDSAGGVIGGSW